ncbi:MAG: putative Glutamate--LysW ligase ArgX [Promethearchaeota archaeon]|nr:MAG: putative Glutamate--LysW ligase ArgX [Candidatus Lokiarchaeota archaeon]
MRIGILHNRITWEIKEIIQILDKRKIDYDLINNQQIYFKLTREEPFKVHYDVILERSLSFLRGLYSASILEAKGCKVINSYNCLNNTGNKLLTTLRLIEHNISTPLTYVSFKAESTIEAIETEVNYPAVLKPIIGSWGRLIAKLEDYNDARSNLECRELMGNVLQKIYYIQEYIHPQDPTMPTDLRVFVIGKECVAAMGRFNPKDDFRSNIALGGSAKGIVLNDDIIKISLNAAKAVKGEIVGVDLMMKENNLCVIEVNGTPQFKGITTATKINIAEKIVDYLEDKYK